MNCLNYTDTWNICKYRVEGHTFLMMSAPVYLLLPAFPACQLFLCNLLYITILVETDTNNFGAYSMSVRKIPKKKKTKRKKKSLNNVCPSHNPSLTK